MRASCLHALFGMVLLSGVTAMAGGPLMVGSPTMGVDGQPYVWDNSRPIVYTTDGGPLGTVDNSTATQMVAQEFQAWAAAPGTSLSIVSGGAIQGVPGGDVRTVADFNNVQGSCVAGTQSPIVYDNDGTLLQQLTGDDSVVGLTALCKLSPGGKIQSAIVVLGNPQGESMELLRATMLHEFGHFLGLDHTDVGVPFSGTSQADIDATPTMYYLLSTPNQQTLSVDDDAWIAKLYPAANYSSAYGVLTGEVFAPDGSNPLQDILVVARAVNDIHVTVVSSISGYRFTGNPGQTYSANYLPCTPVTACPGGFFGNNSGGDPTGSRNPVLIGRYEIPVPPGQYNLEVNVLQSAGVIGPINPPLALAYPEEYLDVNESNHDWNVPGNGLPDPKTVTVSAGQTVDDLNFILNGLPAAFDIFEHSANGNQPQQLQTSGKPGGLR